MAGRIRSFIHTFHMSTLAITKHRPYRERQNERGFAEAEELATLPCQALTTTSAPFGQTSRTRPLTREHFSITARILTKGLRCYFRNYCVLYVPGTEERRCTFNDHA